MRDEEIFAWMALTRAPALDMSALTQTLGRTHEAGQWVREFLTDSITPASHEKRWLEHPAHHLLPFTDGRYPAALRSLSRFPVALYVEGNPDVLNDPQLAIVGSRNPTPSGRDIAFEFAESLATRGLSITSGLAEGIDSAAHRGALRAQGVTLAILGNGVDVLYPECNRELSERIRVQGALISEFPLGTPPRRTNFPQRNRLLATMTLGTLVVEAAKRSGSLITARLAGEHNKELFAVPGSIKNPMSRGCHELIRNGAKLTESAADILCELNFSAFFAHVQSNSPTPLATPETVPFEASFGVPAAPPGMEAGMDKDHKILLDALDFDPADLDSLVVRTGFKPEAVSSMMLILELEGHVQAAPGGRYSRVVRSRG